MRCQKYLSYLGTGAAALLVGVLTFSSLTPLLKAQPLNKSVTFPPTNSSRGGLSRTAGGAQRTAATCVSPGTPLTVLAPNNNVGTTVSDNPSMFWFVPKTQAKSAEFVVVDEEGNDVYLTTLALNGTPGVVKLALPDTVTLEPGKTYTWQLALICDPNNRRQDEFVRGNLQRTELSAEQKAKLAQSTTPIQKAELYAQARVWQDAISILAQQRQERPNDSAVTTAWQDLLKSVQLDAIATAPLVECCSATTALQ